MPETSIKDGFEEMKHKFAFGAFNLEKQDYLFRPVLKCPRKFSTELTKN